jgi:hypothetical protein
MVISPNWRVTIEPFILLPSTCGGDGTIQIVSPALEARPSLSEIVRVYLLHLKERSRLKHKH